jgi:hypothetical protein
MNYITTIISSEYMQIGGFGHIFHDLLTSYIISHMVKNLKFVYYPISSLGDDHHKNLKHDDIFNKINWDSFLKFSENEIHFNDIKDKVNNIINIKLCDPFMTFTIDKFTEIIKNKTNTLFVITQNNRIHINEIYYTNNDIYNKIKKNLENKLLHLKKIKSTKLTIAMHIRRGDWCWQPIKYNINFINIITNLKINDIPINNYIIKIYSLGKEDQMKRLKNKLKNITNNIEFHLNTNVFDTFSDIYNADIIIGGHSGFPKIISMLSNNIIIYLPYKDGNIPALGVNNIFKLYHHGIYPELYDKQHRIETDIYVKKNRKLIENKIIELYNKYI